MTRPADFHHRSAFRPITNKQIATEAVKFLLVGMPVGFVMVWAWTKPV